MNQTKKRLQIINLAISIGDTETIQLQMLKLSPLKSDEKIQEIIAGLQAENYAQTQTLITTYIETPTEEILQRTSQHTPPSPEEEEAIIEEFDLFKVAPEEEPEEIKEILDLERFKEEESPKKMHAPKVDYDALLNLKSDEVLADNIDIKQTLAPEDDFFKNRPHDEPYNYTEVIEKDDFFHTSEDEPVKEESEPLFETLPQQETDEDDGSSFFSADTVPQTVSSIPGENRSGREKSDSASAVPFRKRTEKTEPVSYDAIAYIDQKLKNMRTQYPALEEPETEYASVNAWLLKISNEGYTEQEIEEMLAYIQKLSREGKRAEAAQLLLISAATHSKYAQFMLARALFKGELLEKNLPEAFTLINRLAMDDDYAEAICDLGQLYEHGIGIGKDTKQAEILYKEAMDLGIKRARPHYERVHKANRGLFGRLFKK